MRFIRFEDFATESEVNHTALVNSIISCDIRKHKLPYIDRLPSVVE